MMAINPANIKIEDYNYKLPVDRIAKYPLEERDLSQLLVYKKGALSKSKFTGLYQFLEPKSLLIFNNTKVIQARLIFTKPTGAQIEIFCLEPLEPSDYTLAFQQQEKVKWKCIVGNSKKWKTRYLDKEIEINGTHILLKAKRAGEKRDSQAIEFSWDNNRYTFSEILENIGVTPIPPYLNRKSEDLDKIRYQTVYSKIKGSVAAPTAGLHFTDRVLNKLKETKVEIDEITLHVGAGTFKPVKSDTIDMHEMHTEHFAVSKKTIVNILKSENITVVGTTSVRTLESLYWLGVKLKSTDNFSAHISQWEAYELTDNISRKEALTCLLNYMEDKKIENFYASTQIMIVPGYTFKMTNALITNFHQPCSTLLLLIAAFIGYDWKKVYDFALKSDFRFLSYGDSSILIP